MPVLVSFFPLSSLLTLLQQQAFVVPAPVFVSLVLLGFIAKDFIRHINSVIGALTLIFEVFERY
jgi:hypothetical protein